MAAVFLDAIILADQQSSGRSLAFFVVVVGRSCLRPTGYETTKPGTITCIGVSLHAQVLVQNWLQRLPLYVCCHDGFLLRPLKYPIPVFPKTFHIRAAHL